MTCNYCQSLTIGGKTYHQTECERPRHGQPIDLTIANSLPNGAQILSRFQTDPDAWLVLCTWIKGKEREYCTWRVDPNTGEAFWGHYFGTFVEAQDDFRKRIRIAGA